MQLGAAAFGGSAVAGTQPASDPMLGKVVEGLDGVRGAVEAAASAPRTIDNSITIAGNVYGGDAGKRQLARELDEARRRDSNRVIR